MMKQKEEIKSNFISGMVGAFLGSLIGCALWVLIYRMGYIAGIAGAVTGVCAMKGYVMFGKTLDRKGVICSVLMMFVMIYFANHFSWALEVYNVYKSDGVTFGQAYQVTSEVIEYSNATSSYVKDLIIGYALTILCTYKTIISAFKASAKKAVALEENTTSENND